MFLVFIRLKVYIFALLQYKYTNSFYTTNFFYSFFKKKINRTGRENSLLAKTNKRSPFGTLLAKLIKISKFASKLAPVRNRLGKSKKSFGFNYYYYIC
jgi:hypothetical protein